MYHLIGGSHVANSSEFVNRESLYIHKEANVRFATTTLDDTPACALLVVRDDLILVMFVTGRLPGFLILSFQPIIRLFLHLWIGLH